MQFNNPLLRSVFFAILVLVPTWLLTFLGIFLIGNTGVFVLFDTHVLYDDWAGILTMVAFVISLLYAGNYLLRNTSNQLKFSQKCLHVAVFFVTFFIQLFLRNLILLNFLTDLRIVF